MLQDKKVVESLPADYWEDDPQQQVGGFDYRDRWNKFNNSLVSYIIRLS
jgi:hypothetical protein